MGPVDSLDHASRLVNYGSKMGVDATRKWPGEGFYARLAGVLRMPADVKEKGGRIMEKSRIVNSLLLIAFACPGAAWRRRSSDHAPEDRAG